MSAEQRAKISAARKGQPSPLRGRPKTKAHRQAIARGMFRYYEERRKSGH